MLRIARATLVAAALLAVVPLSAQTAVESNPLLFTVNGEEVYAADVSLVMKSVQAHFRQLGQEPPNDQLMRLATQRIVEQKLFAQEARRLGLKPDEERLTTALDGIANQAGGRETLEAQLAKAGTSYQRLADNLREGDLAQVYVDTKIVAGVTVSDEELKQYYDANPTTFQMPDQVRARHILIKVAEDADEVAVAEARTRAEAARSRVLAGEEFAKVAIEVSEDPSAGNGGDLGVFTADRMVEPFSKAAFALEPGAVSELVRTTFGFHVIKVEERRPAGVTPFEEAKEPLKRALRMSKIQGAIRDTIERLRASATIENRAPEAAVPAEPISPTTPAPAAPESSGGE